MSRKLATITKIKATTPIAGADFIEVASMTTNNWVCVVKKGDFVPGDFGVYFEIDSFLPKEERYVFLDGRSNKTWHGVEGYRLRTIKLRGHVSQGLVLPLSLFPEIQKPEEGNDVTELLNVKLYELLEPPSFNMGSRRRKQPRLFPYFLRKTDQERLQSLSSERLTALSGRAFEVTEKLDGTSATYYYKDGHFGVCSRNLELPTSFNKNILMRAVEWFRKRFLWRNFEKQFGFPRSIYEHVAASEQINVKMAELYETLGVYYAIQGEIVGPTISDNRLKLNKICFYVFDVYDIDHQVYVDAAQRYNIVSMLGLEHVPVIELSAVLDFEKTPIVELIKSADGKSCLSDAIREGLVYKQRGEHSSQDSFKIISNEYLLKHGL
ncbi:MAG: hypothetical protein LBQ50_00810 [Planctomycetaceae bacterium]|jgi:RNA ligase (TIGR02306 family)|nr:hypothetical protein [Planctomycetaceae bacterium]